MAKDERFPGMKDNKRKARWDLVPFEPLDQLAALYTVGAFKYEDHGWKKMDPAEGIIAFSAAAMRHRVKIARGEDLDQETGLSHWTAVAWNDIACLYFAEKLGITTTIEVAWKRADWDAIREKYAKEQNG